MADPKPFDPSDFAVVVEPSAVSLRPELQDGAVLGQRAHLIPWEEIGEDPMESVDASIATIEWDLGNRCTKPVWRARGERGTLGAWSRSASAAPGPGGQSAVTCSPGVAGRGGGTVRGPISAASSAGSSRERVWAQYLGASSR